MGDLAVADLVAALMALVVIAIIVPGMWIIADVWRANSDGRRDDPD